MFGRGTNDGIKDTTSDFKAEEQERYIPSRNPMVQVLQKSKHKIHKPKKGKGSYRRIKHGMV
tara:strand:- start:575 stop:760 length:186 start_codon:yes stop_codon:yes gene_type:complete